MKKTKYSSDYRIRWWLSLHILCLLPDETIGNNIDKVTENSATTSADAATKAEAKTDTKADAEVGGVAESEEAVVGISDLSEADDAELYGAIFGTVVQDKDCSTTMFWLTVRKSVQLLCLQGKMLVYSWLH